MAERVCGVDRAQHFLYSRRMTKKAAENDIDEKASKIFRGRYMEGVLIKE
jgi:hypothetical protein